MPNLVGIGNSQVPTNAMLGGLAYQNSNNVSIQKGELGNIAEIRAKLNITPIDYNHYGIFVYDTSMDSDGGAWRHRTSHTSWYNEGPSRYRGHRKEFPSIAVIVSDTDQVSIYDGDDPNLSLWMTFQAFSGGGGMAPNYVLQYSGSAYRVAMLNGILVMGQGSGGDNWGNPIVNFISEEIVRADPHTTEGGRWAGNIASRNGYNGAAAEGYVDPGSGFIIRDSRIRGVAMRVMSDAITDPKTGLPIPTIALCSTGGVSVITANNEDRNVYDVTASAGSSYNISVFIDITETGCIIFEQDGSNGRSIFHIPIPTGDRTSNTNDGSITDKVILKAYNNSTSASYPRYNEPWTTTQGIMKGVAMRGDNQALLSFAGKLTLLQPNFHDPYQGRTAYITKDFNTGWMYGGNRRVLLCDTDDTNMTATNLITNGDFTSSTTGWTAQSGWGTIAVVSGRLRMTNANGQNGFAYQQITVVAGQTYILMADCYKGTNSRVSMQVNSVGGSMSVSRNPITTDGKYMLQFTPDTNTVQLNMGQGLTGNGNYTEVDNVSVRLASHDRSTQAQGMEVIGTLNRTKIYPGSDLVYYDNFANGYLFQPYSPNNGFADLRFGTGEYYMSIWAYGGADNQTMMVLERDDTDAHGAILLYLQSGKYAFYSRSNGTSSWSSITGNAAYGNWWSHVMVVRRGNNIEGWANGNYQGNVALSGSGNTNGGSQSRDLVIGRRNGHGQIFSGRLALAKIGSGAPLAEDIKKMYDDERKLFAPNAKCTLYGTSDVVESMAYDKSTDILHAITNQGRSDFVGLNRINNTTTNSDRAISAAGGLVAED